jgi:hypothetical protein
LAVTIWVTVAPPYTDSPPIRADGLGYYAWSEAIVHRNFDESTGQGLIRTGVRITSRLSIFAWL